VNIQLQDYRSELVIPASDRGHFNSGGGGNGPQVQ